MVNQTKKYKNQIKSGFFFRDEIKITLKCNHKNANGIKKQQFRMKKKNNSKNVVK